MDGEALKRTLDIIGWSYRQVAQRRKCDEAIIRRMANDDQPIPPKMARKLTIIERCIEANPLEETD